MKLISPYRTEPRNKPFLLVATAFSNCTYEAKKMEEQVRNFKEVCPIGWSDEVTRRMITKHGLENTIDIALGGGKPDVELPPPDTVVLEDDSPPQPVEEVAFEAPKIEEEQKKENSPIPPPVHSLPHPKPKKSREGLNTSLNEQEEEAWLQELRYTLQKKVSRNSSLIADDDAEFPDSQEVEPILPVINDLTPSSSTPQRRMTVLEDDYKHVEPIPAPNFDEADLRPRKENLKRAHDVIESKAPAPKRVSPIETPNKSENAKIASPPTSQQSPPPSPIKGAPTSPLALTKEQEEARKFAEAEKIYIKSLGVPNRLSDLPPHDFGKMQSLALPTDGALGTMFGNIALWDAMTRKIRETNSFAEKSLQQRRSELLMIVDYDFAYSEYGSPVMDLLESSPELSVRILAAKLPARNTMIFRRVNHETDITETRTDNINSSSDLGSSKGDEQNFRNEVSHFSGSNGNMSARPITDYTVDLDHYIMFLTPTQWESAHFNDGQISFFEEAQFTYPGKHLTVFVLHPLKTCFLPTISHMEAGELSVKMQLKHRIKQIIVEHGRDAHQIAHQLAHIYYALANRVYDFPESDGPFSTFPISRVDRSLYVHDIYLNIFKSCGLPPATAEAVFAKYPSLMELSKACEKENSAQAQQNSLRIQTTASIAHATELWNAFINDTTQLEPYKRKNKVS